MPASILSRDSRAAKLDLMTFDPQVIHMIPVNLNYINTTTGTTGNNAIINPRGFWNSADGQLSIASDNIINNIATVPLFT